MNSASTAVIPDYLRNTYWWAYLHPRGVRLFERRWMVNLILFGNYRRLCNEVIDLVKQEESGNSLQIACVYGDLTERLAQYHNDKQSLHVIDVAPIQLANLQRKLGADHAVSMTLNDSTNLLQDDDSYQRSIIFFLLHEQPWQERIQTLKEAIRVTKPGGQLIIVDYHKPVSWSPVRFFLPFLLNKLEPFAMDLWRHQVSEWLPTDIPPENISKQTFFGGLYQKLVITLPQ